MLGFIQKYKLLIIIAVLVLLGAAVYQLEFADDDGTVSFLSKDTNISGSIVGNEIIGILNELEAIDLSGDIFKDPAFVTLIDFQRGVGPKLIGRSNPFAPIGSTAGAVGFIELPIVKLIDPPPSASSASPSVEDSGEEGDSEVSGVTPSGE